MKQIQNHFLFPLFLILSVSSSTAQPVDYSQYVQWSPEYANPGWIYEGGKANTELLSNGDILIYKIESGRLQPSIVLAHYNTQLQLVSDNRIKLKFKDSEAKVRQVVFLKDYFYVLTVQKNNANTSTSVTLFKIDPRTGEVFDTPAFTTIVSGVSDFKNPAAAINVSENNKHLLVYIQSQEKWLLRESDIHLWVFDENIEKSWEQSFQVPFSRATCRNFQFWVNDEGMVFGHAYRSDDENWNQSLLELDKFSTIISKVSEDNSFEFYQVPKSDVKRRTFTPARSRNGDLKYIGMYYHPDKRELKGMYFQDFDAYTLRPERNSYSVFEESIIHDEEGHLFNWVRSNKFYFKSWSQYSDGSMIFIAERVTPELTSSIILGCTDESGTFIWHEHIKKAQEREAYLDSYVYADYGADVFIIFGDNAKNYEEESNDYPRKYKGKKPAIIMKRFSQEGAVETAFLTNMEDKQEEVLFPFFSKQLENDLVLLVVKHKFTFRLGILDLSKLPKF